MKNVSIKINIPIVKYHDNPFCQTWVILGFIHFYDQWLQGRGINRKELYIFKLRVYHREEMADFPQGLINWSFVKWLGIKCKK